MHNLGIVPKNQPKHSEAKKISHMESIFQIHSHKWEIINVQVYSLQHFL